MADIARGDTGRDVTVRCDPRPRLNPPRHELGARASGIDLPIADHLRTLAATTVRSRRFVRVYITERRPGSAGRGRFLAVPR